MALIKESVPDAVHIPTLELADAAPVKPEEEMMNNQRAIDSCISVLKEMLGDPNSELSSEQRSKLRKGIRSLKRLQKATKLTHAQVFKVVSEIAEAAFETLES